MKNITDNGIKNLSNITNLNLRNNVNITDNGIENLSNITKLYVDIMKYNR